MSSKPGQTARGSKRRGASERPPSERRPRPNATNAPARSDEEIAFMKAMDAYQRTARRPFPTWSEVLEVLRSLGYTKKQGPGAPPRDGGEWRRLCNELREERDRLLLKVAEFRKERDDYLKALYALTREDFDLDKKVILAQLGRNPPLADLVSELESGDGE